MSIFINKSNRKVNMGEEVIENTHGRTTYS